MASTLRLDADMTIVNAALQRQQLLAALRGGEGELILDLSAVDSIDSAGMQLLIATRRSLSLQERSLRLMAMQPPVADALQVYDLHPLFAAAPGERAS